MQSQEPLIDPRQPPKPQFGLRTLLGLFVVAAMLGSIFTMPEWLGGMVAFFLMLALPVTLVTLLVYGRGYLRAFCIGALVPSGAQVIAVAIVFMLLMFDRPSRLRGLSALFEIFDEIGGNIRVAFVTLALLSLATGALAVGVRWLVERPYRA